MASIKLVFADCFECGMRKTWAENQKAVAEANKLDIVKIPFYVDEASELIRLALKQQVRLPFFTDGEKCSQNIEDFIEKEEKSEEVEEEQPKKTKRSRKKAQKVETEDENVVSE